MRRKLGRPQGAKTKAETVGKKRARRYFDLTFEQGVRSTRAADLVAEEFSCAKEDVFKAKKRHEPALALEVMKEASEIEKEVEARRAALIGPPERRGQAWLLAIIRDAIKRDND